jgi:D-aminopeptidase
MPALPSPALDSVTVAFDASRIDAILAPLNRSDLPGAAVGIALGNRPVYRRGFGLASMELPIVLSPSMRMRIGSTSKHFTVLAYLLLCEEGRARIDDPLVTYLPELHAVTHRVTLRQLMGNIGGLRDALDITWQFSGTGRALSNEHLLSLYYDMNDLNAEPGTEWIYNNGGFLLLATVIERITGQPLEAVLRERIFEPVGMHDTLLRRFDSDFVANSATLHTRVAGQYEKLYLGTASAGAGGIVSTVDDMLRWLAHMDAPVVGSFSTWAAMKTPLVLANGTSTGYGLALMSGRYRGVEVLSHPGGVMGGNAQMLKVPAAGLDVAIMVNRSDVSAMMLAEKVIDACIPGLRSADEPCDAPFAAGIFRSPTTGRVIQLSVSDGQQIVSIDGLDVPFIRRSDGTLSPGGIFNYMKQSVTLFGDPASPTALRLENFGNVDELRAVEPCPAPDHRSILGCYRSEATGTEARIIGTPAGVRMISTGRFGSAELTLSCLAQGIWRARPARADFPPGGVLSFDTVGFRFSSFRTWSLPFRRIP